MTQIDQEWLGELLCGHFSQNVEVERRTDMWALTLPFLDELNDRVEVGLWKDGARWVVSDRGFVHREVALKSGAEKADASVWDEVTVAANGFDLKWGGGQLWQVADDAELADVVLRLAEAMLVSVQSAGQFVHEVNVRFWEEVKLFFDDSGISYERNKKFVGVSEVQHRVDFTLLNGATHLVQAIASETSMRRSLNIFYDILDAQPSIRPVAFVDESKSGYSNETFEQLAFKSDLYFWKDRKDFSAYWAERR